MHFRHVEEFLAYLPENELSIVEKLRSIVLETVPNVIEKLSYNVPYYKRQSNICFIWPSSIPWGNVKNSGVRLGFTKGYLLSDESGYLNKGNRKQVFWKDYFSLKEIDKAIIQRLLFEAVVLDEHKIKTMPRNTRQPNEKGNK